MSAYTRHTGSTGWHMRRLQQAHVSPAQYAGGATAHAGGVLSASTARWRSSSASSKRWLKRQRKDAFGRGDHRSRAFHKLEQLDQKHRLFAPGIADGVVIDLGAAPGGWTEYVAREQQRQQMQAEERGGGGYDDDGDDDNDGNGGNLFGSHYHGGGRVVGVDLLPMEPIPGAVLIEGDFRQAAVRAEVAAAARGMPVRWVLSDMAPNTSGDKSTDHFRSLDLCLLALEFATSPSPFSSSGGGTGSGSGSESGSGSGSSSGCGSGGGGGGSGGGAFLAPGGGFLCKLFKGRDERELLEAAREAGFAKHAKWVKPPASRNESPEVFFLATGFRS